MTQLTPAGEMGDGGPSVEWRDTVDVVDGSVWVEDGFKSHSCSGGGSRRCFCRSRPLWQTKTVGDGWTVLWPELLVNMFVVV